jgi:hypothetical protein
MPHRIRDAALAAAAALCLTGAAPAEALTIRLDPEPAWRSAPDLAALTEELERWLDVETDYPRRAAQPALRLIGAAEAAALPGTATRSAGRTRGLYDPDTATIYLVQPWSMRRAQDVAVLLHELVHHRQTGARHWYCPGAQEPEAYALQQEWLGRRGLEARVNRIAVVLAAGCTPRDIHPD